MLKKLFFSFFLIFSLFSNSQAFSKEDAVAHIHKKYIEVSDLEISNAGITYICEDVQVSLPQLFCDDAGLFILVDSNEATVGLWTCPSCWQSNSSFKTKCSYCGWPD